MRVVWKRFQFTLTGRRRCSEVGYIGCPVAEETSNGIFSSCSTLFMTVKSGRHFKTNTHLSFHPQPNSGQTVYCNVSNIVAVDIFSSTHPMEQLTVLRHLPVHFHLQLVVVVMRGSHLQAQVARGHGTGGGFGPRHGVGTRPVGRGGRGGRGGELVGEVFLPLGCGVGEQNKCHVFKRARHSDGCHRGIGSAAKSARRRLTVAARNSCDRRHEKSTCST